MLSSDGQPLMMADGKPRKGRGLSEGTFRKHFFGLKTLHVHFHRKQVYEVGLCVSIQDEPERVRVPIPNMQEAVLVHCCVCGGDHIFSKKRVKNLNGVGNCRHTHMLAWHSVINIIGLLLNNLRYLHSHGSLAKVTTHEKCMVMQTDVLC